ncbi:TPR-like protein [Rhizoctonia solani]|uniref:TPR-like protein n=1 Tax=Rhizoctonia solani TaxID=456999 RepID=A0A8H7IC73_9AGAM|nr:TPR-like protein [Rhizoctonia solani]
MEGNKQSEKKYMGGTIKQGKQEYPEHGVERVSYYNGEPKDKHGVTEMIVDAPPNYKELIKLSVFHLNEFQLRGKLEGIDKAIGYNNEALSLTPEDHPDLTQLLANLAVGYGNRFQRTGNMDDLEKSIECSSRAVELTPNNHPGLPQRLASLGGAYSDSFKRTGNVKDLEKSMEYSSRAVTLTPDNHPCLPQMLANLAVSYGDRFKLMDEMSDLTKSMEYKSRAVALTPNDHPYLPQRLASLGVAYNERFRRTGNMSDLAKSIEYLSCAVALVPENHPDLPRQLANLAVAYGNRFKCIGSMDDLTRLMEYSSRAVELTPDNHPDLPQRLAILGVGYTDRFRRTGNMNDLVKSMEYSFRAVDLTPDNHSHLPQRLANLALCYTNRFKRTDDMNDLAKSIECSSRAVELTPNNHPDLPQRLTSLGVSYSERFKRTGNISDLANSAECSSRSVTLTPDNHPDLPQRLVSLAVGYDYRFQRTGDLNDLTKSMEYCSRAVELTPHNHPHLPQRLSNLALCYTNRFKRTGDMNDLGKSVEYSTRAVSLTPENHPDLPQHIDSLGVAYSELFKSTGDMNDLTRSMEYSSRAVALTPNNHPDLPYRLANLAVGYGDRFKRTGDMNDLAESIEYFSRAVALTSDDHPDLSRHHFSLSLSYFTHYDHTSYEPSLSSAMLSLRTAAQLLAGPPRDRFMYALEWAQRAAKHNPDDCMEAYRTAVNLLPQFIWLGAPTDQQYQDLLMAEDLAVNAASTAILSSAFDVALEWLEHARCVVWSQSLALRSPLDRLYKSHPDMAAQLRTISNALHQTDTESSASRKLAPELKTSIDRHGLAVSYERLLTQIRTLDGFEDFLLPMKSDRLIDAARSGPVIVINCSERCCDALVVIPGQVTISHVHLPNFTKKKAQEARDKMEASLWNKNLRERGVRLIPVQGYKDGFASVLLDLWTDIVRPVLDFLGYIESLLANDRDLPHVTWCPTGVLSFLPLHAAGDYGQPGCRVFNYVVSSYIPTLTTLLASPPSTISSTPRVLAIGQANTPKHTPLPGTTTELELIKAHTQSKGEYSQLIDSQATTAAVLDAMDEHDWVHLACHAHQNVTNATKSGFFLHDGTLDLAAINRRSFRNKGLAFLSLVKRQPAMTSCRTKRYTLRRHADGWVSERDCDKVS